MTTPDVTPPDTHTSRRSRRVAAERAPRPGVGSVILNALRGALIGLVELIPGVSGGTVALITGVYERLIHAASHVIGAIRHLVTGPDRLQGFAARLRQADWLLVLPLLAGMITAVLTVAGLVEGFVTANPVLSRGLFFGLVAASVLVPVRLLPTVSGGAARRLCEGAVLVGAAAAAFFLTGLADGGAVENPPMWAVFLAAVIAICALVVPGVSGAFFLLAVGLYAPTLRALHERDLGYIAVFGAGAVVGLVTIVQVIHVLLERHRRITLIAMIGLMLGSLRALWPWQTSESGAPDGVGILLWPSGEIAAPIALAVGGAAAVLALIAVESRIQRRALAVATA